MVITPLPPIEDVFSSSGRLRILLALAKQGEINITALSKITRLNHTRIQEHLETLKKMNIVQEKRFGRIRIFGLNLAYEAGRRIKEFLNYWDTGYEIHTHEGV